jgi:translation initiation factor IF-2
MAEVIVSELAKVVGASEERLLAQMKEAGLKHKKASEKVSDDEKQTLLAYLKSLHGGGSEAGQPRKITLKRKKVETIKTSGVGGRKTVNVEVRKKRTYVQRSQEEIDTQAKAEEEVKQSQMRPGGVTSTAIDDAESKRLAAHESRRKAVEDEKVRIEDDARFRREEEQKRRETAEARKKDKDALGVPKVAAQIEQVISAPEKGGKDIRHGATDEDLEDGKSKKKRAGGKAKPHNPVADSEDKDWRKHSHRPQDFELHEDDNDEEQERKKLLIDAQKTVKPVKNTHTFKKPTAKIVHEVELSGSITVGDLAQKMAVKSGAVIKSLMKMGEMATINQALDQDTATLVVEEFGHTVVVVSENAVEEELRKEMGALGGVAEPRAPVVTVMGHVDHGKTSLLDYIREAKVASGEAGGITQHIGAYSVSTDHGSITFLDTPGHAAFTAMRARGAQSTDVVILVVAADDGVMPQTKEAVEHSRAAGVPIVVAVNKMDKEGADPERVKNELSAVEVIPEDWGGEVPFIPVSAHTGEGIEALLEAVSLIAELAELTAPITGPAQGVIVESRVEKGRGVVCTALVQQGSLQRGDILLAGNTYGRVRAMTGDDGTTVDQAGPSVPVEVLGLDEAPQAGDDFMVVKDDRTAREISDARHAKHTEQKQARKRTQNLESMFSSMTDEIEQKILTIVLKADVRGSAEAIIGALEDLGNEEVGVNVISSGVGGISESDINLALTTGAIVLGFNVRADSGARSLAEKENIEIRYYSIIYQLIDEVKQALSGMLDPEQREEIVGIAEVRDVFRSPKFGQIAGCMVTEGSVFRNKPIRVLRDNVVIYEGQLESLRRFKEDAGEVRNGMECGIGVKDYNDVQSGDQIEVFEIKQVERSL